MLAATWSPQAFRGRPKHTPQRALSGRGHLFGTARSLWSPMTPWARREPLGRPMLAIRRRTPPVPAGAPGSALGFGGCQGSSLGHRGALRALHSRLGSLSTPAWSWAVQRPPARPGVTLEGRWSARAFPGRDDARAAAGGEWSWPPVRHSRGGLGERWGDLGCIPWDRGHHLRAHRN